MSQATGAALPFDRFVAVEGSAAATWRRALVATGSRRDLADAVHALCAIHAAYPGVIDHAARHDSGAASHWLADAATGFAAERTALARLAAAVGPAPSTPAQDRAAAAIAGQRRALELLAGSDRVGCALGAAAALVLDWQAIRAVLDAAADQVALTAAPTRLPTTAATLRTVREAEGAATVARALRFGAEQLLAQHRGLWDLLEARAGARG